MAYLLLSGFLCIIEKFPLERHLGCWDAGLRRALVALIRVVFLGGGEGSDTACDGEEGRDIY